MYYFDIIKSYDFPQERAFFGKHGIDLPRGIDKNFYIRGVTIKEKSARVSYEFVRWVEFLGESEPASATREILGATAGGVLFGAVLGWLGCWLGMKMVDPPHNITFRITLKDDRTLIARAPNKAYKYLKTMVDKS